MITRCRSRAYQEGWAGRRRWYRCRKCDDKFQVDVREPLPESERLCPQCRGQVDLREQKGG